MKRVVISVDAMGGDQGPAAVVAGCAKAAKTHPEMAFILHGPEQHLKKLVRAKLKRLEGRVEIRDATEVVRMEDKPSHVMRHGQGTSMWSALDSVRDGDAAVAVSCGNTGALMASAMIRLRKQKGVNRPAIAALWPSRNPQGFNVMLDIGADIRADAQDLLRYAVMGASYARNGLDLKRPRVGLLNVGIEEHKGRPELHEAHSLIERFAEDGGYDYAGYVEGGDIPGDIVDVIVTDGFTGNIAVKTGEGTASLFGDLLKEAFKYSPMSRFASLLALTSLRRLKKRIDPRRVNGGVFLGLNGTVVKSHGNADATAVAAAVRLAFLLGQTGFNERLAARVASAAALSQNGANAGNNDPDSDRKQA
ncbi:phosphate acyltransferase PlsX [Chachezhania sediminis]|uniref:phosphate acyltransferase PlsX n=1 Tax=Chachezhania sediminis TaxID=2599291 RepID=UPI001E3FA0EA|nr:phosphate acyltransferase PlsX [Chachezhania sediminis]